MIVGTSADLRNYEDGIIYVPSIQTIHVNCELVSYPYYDGALKVQGAAAYALEAFGIPNIAGWKIYFHGIRARETGQIKYLISKLDIDFSMLSVAIFMFCYSDNLAEDIQIPDFTGVKLGFVHDVGHQEKVEFEKRPGYLTQPNLEDLYRISVFNAYQISKKVEIELINPFESGSLKFYREGDLAAVMQQKMEVEAFHAGFMYHPIPAFTDPTKAAGLGI